MSEDDTTTIDTTTAAAPETQSDHPQPGDTNADESPVCEEHLEANGDDEDDDEAGADADDEHEDLAPVIDEGLVVTQKDASRASFYAGFLKGAGSALDGIQLFCTSPKLRSIAWEVAKPLRNAELAYASAGVLIFLLFRNPSAGLSDFLWTISRWGHVVTVITALILDKGFDANSTMFFAAIRERRPSFADALAETPTVRISIRERLSNFKRVGKLTAFKAAGSIIRAIIPGGQYIAIPAVKFVSMRPVLGSPIAAAVAAVHAVPSQVLESSHFDDALVSFGEAVVDADDFGSDITKKFTRRMAPDVRDYFSDRYRGYLAGCGFVYSLISAIPFVGIPMLLIAECGAACLVVDIVERNMSKGRRIPLPCEDKLVDDKANSAAETVPMAEKKDM